MEALLTHRTPEGETQKCGTPLQSPSVFHCVISKPIALFYRCFYIHMIKLHIQFLTFFSYPMVLRDSISFLSVDCIWLHEVL